MANKKLINDPENLVQEMLKGYVKAFEDRVYLAGEERVLARKPVQQGEKVGVTIGNGAGHEPAVIGWVGEGMLDANAVGDLFAAPGPERISAAVRESDSGHGVVLLISNHSGDVMNAGLAMDELSDESYKVEPVILYDDVASAPKGEEEERRGALGTLFNYKITGTFAENSKDIEAVKEVAQNVRDSTRSIGVGLESGTSPVTSESLFKLPDDQIEVGLGVHGDEAAGRQKFEGADGLARQTFSMLIEDLEAEPGSELLVIVNSMGGTTLMELFTFYNSLENYAKSEGYSFYKPLVGELITTQETAGVSVAICRAEPKFKKLWQKPTKAPYFPEL